MSISSELKSEVAVMRRLLVSGANFRLQHTCYLGYIQATLLLNKTIGTPSAVLKGHCIEFKYYADGVHSGLTPPG